MNRAELSFIILIGTAIIFSIVLLALSPDNPTSSPVTTLESPNESAFIIESGPDLLGWSKVYTIRHKETGKRFIFTEEPDSSTMTPLD